jgi:hypothetical protein
MLAAAPALLTLGELSTEESNLLTHLRTQIMLDTWHLTLLDAYYNGDQIIRDLGIALPPQLRGLSTVVGWPAMAVDSIEERLNVQGFRYPGSTDVDSDLEALWQENDLDEEAPLAHVDALALGRSYISVGTPADEDDNDEGAIIRVESPIDMTIDWDPRTRRVLAALRIITPVINRPYYPIEGVLYLPNETVRVELGVGGGWQVLERDEHNLGRVPVVRMVNRSRPHDRVGSSEISAPVMSITDAACRTLMSMETAREFFAAPQRYILGATEASFQAADGTPKSAWQTYIGRVLALERDEEGQLPTVGEFTASDPKSYTELIDAYAKIMAGQTGLPLHYFGYTTDNPASADAIAYSEWRLKVRSERRTTHFGGAWEEVMRLALMMRDGVSSLPAEANRLATAWGPCDIPKPATITDSLLKQQQMGAITPRADVVLEKLGWNAVQREQLREAAKTDAAEQFIEEAATNVLARALRVDKTLSADIGAQQPGATNGAGSNNAPIPGSSPSERG